MMNYQSPIVPREFYEKEKKRWEKRWMVTIVIFCVMTISWYAYFNREMKNVYRANVLQSMVDEYRVRFEILTILRTKGISLGQGLDISNIAIIQSKQLKLPLPLIMAVMGKESEYYPHATSNQGAKGLMQLLPPTFDLYVKQLHLEVSPAAIYDPIVNVKVATHYLKDLYDDYKKKSKTEEETWRLALSCYYSGPEGGIQKGYVKDVNKLTQQIQQKFNRGPEGRY